MAVLEVGICDCNPTPPDRCVSCTVGEMESPDDCGRYCSVRLIPRWPQREEQAEPSRAGCEPRCPRPAGAQLGPPTGLATRAPCTQTLCIWGSLVTLCGGRGAGFAQGPFEGELGLAACLGLLLRRRPASPTASPLRRAGPSVPWEPGRLPWAESCPQKIPTLKS